jgi:hypothetical protein
MQYSILVGLCRRSCPRTLALARNRLRYLEVKYSRPHVRGSAAGSRGPRQLALLASMEPKGHR